MCLRVGFESLRRERSKQPLCGYFILDDSGDCAARAGGVVDGEGDLDDLLSIGGAADDGADEEAPFAAVVGGFPPVFIGLKKVGGFDIGGDGFAGGIGDQDLAGEAVVGGEVAESLGDVVGEDGFKRLISWLERIPAEVELMIVGVGVGRVVGGGRGRWDCARVGKRGRRGRC